jgi:drug/metabolite transporter (DMT)-like permease
MGVLLGVLCLIWGSTWLVIAEGLADLPPMTSAATRFAIAAPIMALVALFAAGREGGAKPPMWLSLVMGITNFGLSYGIVYWSETVLPSGIVAVLWGIYPMMMAACGHFFLVGERLVGRQWGGFALGLGGVVLLFLTDLQRFGPEGIPAALILLVSPLVSAVGTTVVKRHAHAYSSALLNRNGMVVGAVGLGIVALLFEGDVSADWTPAAIGSIVYLAVIGTVVTFGLYFWLLRHAPAYALSLIAYVTPAIALALGWWLGSEPITLRTVGGAVCILAGVVLILRKRRPRQASGDSTTVPRDRLDGSV